MGRTELARLIKEQLHSSMESLSARAIYHYEQGTRSPSLARLRIWASIFDIVIYAHGTDGQLAPAPPRRTYDPVAI